MKGVASVVAWVRALLVWVLDKLLGTHPLTRALHGHDEWIVRGGGRLAHTRQFRAGAEWLRRSGRSWHGEPEELRRELALPPDEAELFADVLEGVRLCAKRRARLLRRAEKRVPLVSEASGDAAAGTQVPPESLATSNNKHVLAPEVREVLTEIWKGLRSDEEPSNWRGWRSLGFQNPPSDFRTHGALALEQLRYFVHAYPQRAADVLGDCARPEWFPFALIGLNITEWLVGFLRDGHLDPLFYQLWEGEPDWPSLPGPLVAAAEVPTAGIAGVMAGVPDGTPRNRKKRRGSRVDTSGQCTASTDTLIRQLGTASSSTLGGHGSSLESVSTCRPGEIQPPNTVRGAAVPTAGQQAAKDAFEVADELRAGPSELDASMLGVVYAFIFVDFNRYWTYCAPASIGEFQAVARRYRARFRAVVRHAYAQYDRLEPRQGRVPGGTLVHVMHHWLRFNRGIPNSQPFLAALKREF